MKGFQVHITGRVQGVGFRPFVFLLANDYELRGFVQNTKGGVIIELNCQNLATVQSFVKQLKKEAPKRSIIDTVTIRESEIASRSGFTILGSQSDHAIDIKISPDFALCENCRAELSNPRNRRYRYAFTTCSVCGPRYSILRALPYDRGSTTMDAFEMCESCVKEYEDPTNRRFYSQTNSCSDCGISMKWYEGNQRVAGLDQEEILAEAIEKLHDGKIIAVKGIGGYLLMCDASNPSTVATLRSRKHRPEKPFALLYAGAEEIERDCYLSASDAKWLTNEVSPILLLEKRPITNHPVDWEGVAPKLHRVGVMIPYAPLLQILADDFGRPLVATSANISGGPIVFDDDQAIAQLFSIADYIMSNDRQILIPQDDSVVRLVGKRPVWYRRSRGLAPSYFGPLPTNQEDGILALGAHLKSSFSFSQNSNWHVSQYLGKLDTYESQQAFIHSMEHLTDLFEAPIHTILADMHPSYFTHQLANDYAGKKECRVVHIQHHEAHFAAVLQENNLIEEKGQTLGVVWDGTGYGTDHQVWGGEFFVYDGKSIDRKAHLKYKPIIGNDKMAIEPRLSLLSFGAHLSNDNKWIQEKFSDTEWTNYQKLRKTAIMHTSSVGRLFDAISSLLGLIDYTTYEGQAAILLEQCAATFTGSEEERYTLVPSQELIDTDTLLTEVIEDLRAGKPTNRIAYKFHLSLVECIRQVAIQLSIHRIAFSGGVFQNGLLVELLQKHLGTHFDLHFHKELSPNDENISFGQLAHYHIQLREQSLTNQKQHYVSSNPW